MLREVTSAGAMWNLWRLKARPSGLISKGHLTKCLDSGIFTFPSSDNITGRFTAGDVLD